jgi:pimeloyl-ACP methyl ester carboxylesterase
MPEHTVTSRFGFLVAIAALCLSFGAMADQPAAPGIVDTGDRVEIAGSTAVTTPATPAKYNKVWVRKYGPANAGHVLVLLAGSPAGQADYDNLATALVARVPNLAVWSFDRRDNAFEDVKGFQAGDASLALCYYLLPDCGFEPVEARDAKFVGGWGATVTLEDIRQVVLAAGAGGTRKVILGGHSMGAITAPTYAAWDFAGHPGYQDLEGLVLIDGGQMGSFSQFLVGTPFAKTWSTVADAKAALAHLAAGTEPFPSVFGFAGPSLGQIPLWPIGVLPELSCQYALEDPQGMSILQLAFEVVQPLLPPDAAKIIPAFPITNEAFIGAVFSSSNDELAALHVRVGHLAPAGKTPRPWVNGPFASVASVCDAYVHEPGNAMAWYYPIRLDMDLILALGSLKRTAVTDYLGMRPYHLADIDLPLFVFETSISKGGVLKAARKFVQQTKTPRHTFVSDESMGHFDPLGDKPANNKFITTVVPFLKTLTAK